MKLRWKVFETGVGGPGGAMEVAVVREG